MTGFWTKLETKMRLWNVLPRNAKEQCLHSISEDVIATVTSFFDQFYLTNYSVNFTVSKILFALPEWDHPLGKVGKSIERGDLREIVSLAMSDKMRIIARGDGCRFFSFGYDFDSWICAKHEDNIPTGIPGLIISDISADLINTDWYDN